MGRTYSYSQPSSSSIRLDTSSEDKAESVDRRSASVDHRCGAGLPERCYCGLRPTIQTSTTDLNPGRVFYGCKHYKDGECHIFKWWDEAVMEEIHRVRCLIENQAVSVRGGGSELDIGHEYADVLVLRDDVARIKARLREKRFRGFVVNIITLAVVFILGLISSYLCFRN